MKQAIASPASTAVAAVVTKFTPSLLSTSTPATSLNASGFSAHPRALARVAETMRLVTFCRTLACSVAPASESRREPTTPQEVARGSTHASVHTLCSPPASRQVARSQDRPTTAPPAAAASVPVVETAPFVPGGARLHGLVTMTGGCLERMPSSEDQVSPLHAEKNLRSMEGFAGFGMRRQRQQRGHHARDDKGSCCTGQWGYVWVQWGFLAPPVSWQPFNLRCPRKGEAAQDTDGGVAQDLHRVAPPPFLELILKLALDLLPHACDA